MEQTPKTSEPLIQPVYRSRTRTITGALSLLAALGVCIVAYLTNNMIPSTKNENSSSIPPETDQIGNFRLLKRIQLNYTDAVITKWQSQETGLRVMHVDYEGPIINGYFAVATEIFDDSGCPHTLEHLIFHGSEQYPYSDALQRVASRYFSATPNAWTAQDSTVYTISTAGQDSFLHLLPVYVDHILYPRLEQSTFVTEVFHINEEGQDAGVVYSEMQGRQNTAPDLVDLAYRKGLYPQGNGYRSETGGLMEALRKLDLEKIKEYHSRYYAPHNLCLIVTGHLSTKALLEEIQKTIEVRATLHGQNLGTKPEGWKRPFIETDSAAIPDFKENMSMDVEFPAKEESSGQINIIMPGPSPQDDLTLGALMLLGEYLAGSIVAPLNQELIDIPAPYCTSISLGFVSRVKFVETHVGVSDVPLKHLDRLEIKIRKTLKKISKRGIDMERLHTIIDRNELSWKQGLEESGGEYFSGSLLFDFMHGDDEGNMLEKQLRVRYPEWRKWSEQQWIDTLTKWVIEPNMLVVRGRPSAAMSERLETEEKKRVAEQISRLGQKGLEEQGKILADAKKANEEPMPDEKIEWIPVPDVRTISWISVQSASTISESNELQAVEENSKELAAYLESDKCMLPYALHFDHISSQFISLTVYISLAEIPENMKHYACIFEVMFFSATITLEDGTELTEEQLIHSLDQDLVSYSFGSCNGYPELFCLSVTADVSKYEAAIQWIRRLLWSSKNTTNKLQNRIAIIKQAIPEYLRDPQSTMAEVEADELYTDRYTSRASNNRRLMQWLPGFERQLKRDGPGVVKELESIRATLLKPSNLQLSVIGDILKLKHPRSSWLENFQELKYAPLSPIVLSRETLSDLGRNPAKKAFVISLPNVESSFSSHHGKGIVGFSDPEIPALIVALDVLSGAELYFWKRIRGAGLAYGAGASLDVQIGNVGFSAWRSPNAIKAYLEARAVVQDLVDGKIPLDKMKLESAKNSYAYSVAASYSSRSNAAEYAFINRVFRGRSSSWIQERLASVQAISEAEVLAVMNKYILPLFDPQSSVAFVVCGPNQVQDMVKGFKDVGFEVEIKEMDDKVPWVDDDQKLSAKAMKWLSKALLTGETLAQRAQELFQSK